MWSFQNKVLQFACFSGNLLDPSTRFTPFITVKVECSDDLKPINGQNKDGYPSIAVDGAAAIVFLPLREINDFPNSFTLFPDYTRDGVLMYG